jgi:hypothetical protein
MEINNLGMKQATLRAPAWRQGQITVDVVVVQQHQGAKTQPGKPQPRKA